MPPGLTKNTAAPVRPTRQRLIISINYHTLVKQVTQELSELELLIKRRTAEGYWRVGKYIHDHLLANEKRAEYGTALYDRLAKDVDCDRTTLLRATQFYRVYPIVAAPRQLTWEHYKSLLTIPDKKERKKLEQQIIRHDWNTKQFRAYLSTRRELKAPPDTGQPVAQLKFTRGQLNTYRIVKAGQPLAGSSPLVLDLGFRLQHVLPPDTTRVKEGDLVEGVFAGGQWTGVEKSAAAQEQLFTYSAQVDKIIDGDTMLVSFDFRSTISISQKLRLRGIDCPEMDTPEGKKAKRFVESRLKDCGFVIVKTYKDRSDKYDRYLADVFYASPSLPSNIIGKTAPAEKLYSPEYVAAEGILLNQELLDERLASVWRD